MVAFRKVLQERYHSLDSVSPSEGPGLLQECAFVNQLRSLVKEHLVDEAFGIPTLCDAMDMSRSQLHLKLKALTSRPTSHFVRLIRLQKAKELLKKNGFQHHRDRLFEWP